MGGSRQIIPVCVCTCALVQVALAAPADAALASRLTAVHRDGQTFLTWRCPQIGSPWTFRVYASSQPIGGAPDLVDSARVAVVRDSSWYDRRLSVALGAVFGYAIDSAGRPLDAAHGLCVITAQEDGSRYYAVTAQQGSEIEDLNVAPGGNALLAAVEERVAAPRPVYQRTITVGARQAEVYTLWTSDRSTPLFPAMANVPGMPFDCAVVRGRSTPPYSSLTIGPHHMSGSFVTAINIPGESVLALDDPVPASLTTFWYGYHEDFDVYSSSNPVRDYGMVHDYTLQRVLYTVLWARRNFPMDTARVYTVGGSLGGIGALMIAFHRPDLIAGVVSVAGKVNFAFMDDPNPLASFNPGGSWRNAADRLWGAVSTNLPSGDGLRVYESLDDNYLARVHRSVGVPPIITFCGKNDATVGWAENIGFYETMREYRHGGYFFWDQRDHGATYPQAWAPMQDTYFYRFRTDRSYPALSNCTADFNPGDGNASSGDSVGCINAFVEWDTALVDQLERWRVTLTLRDLQTLGGPVVAPDTLAVDVTPRRLRRFTVSPGASYRYTVTRVADQVVLQSGTVAADTLGLVTVSGVTVPRAGSRLEIEPVDGSFASPLSAPPDAPRSAGERAGPGRKRLR